MQLARDHFLADAALAAQQYADVAVGDALDHRHDVAHRRARAPERRALGVLADLRAQPRDLAAEHGFFDRVANRRFERRFAETIGIVRLDDVVERALSHRIDDGRRRRAAGQHDDLHVRMGDADRLQRFEAVHAGHRHVEQHHVGRRLAVQALQQIACRW